MKKLAILSLAVLATSSFAFGVTGGGGGGGSSVAPSSIAINGQSEQRVSLERSGVFNKALGGGVAAQNLASNAGNVTIDGHSDQSIQAREAFIFNMADGKDAYASQNLASNVGKVTIDDRAHSEQSVHLHEAFVANMANAGSTAVQNIASNNACVTCNE